jgi:hypothetical protein
MELPGQSMTGDDANKFNIDVQWCGVRRNTATDATKAGYPCTAPRVIVGNGDQAVQVSFILILIIMFSSLSIFFVIIYHVLLLIIVLIVYYCPQR